MMSRRGAGCEDLDDEHAATAAGARLGERLLVVGVGVGGRSGLRFASWRAEQLSGLRDVLFAPIAGEQAVVADAVKAGGQYVDQESADELVGCQRHDLDARWSLEAVILPFERDAFVINGDKAAVGDGDAVSVPRHVTQGLLIPIPDLLESNGVLALDSSDTGLGTGFLI